MHGTFVVACDKRQPGTVHLAGRVPRSAQADLAGALSRAARRGIRQVDLTGLDALTAATVEVLLVLAAEIELELIVPAGGSVERKVRKLGLDSIVPVRRVQDAVCRVTSVA